jgi:Kef-type K+ transport system membrane component KefB
VQASGIFIIASGILFIVLGHILAKRKGLNPVLWGIMGGLLGPLMLLFIMFAKPADKDDSSTDS